MSEAIAAIIKLATEIGCNPEEILEEIKGTLISEEECNKMKNEIEHSNQKSRFMERYQLYQFDATWSGRVVITMPNDQFYRMLKDLGV